MVYSVSTSSFRDDVLLKSSPSHKGCYHAHLESFLGFARRGTFLTRGLCLIFRHTFPLLRPFVPAFKKSPCYWQAVSHLGCLASKEQRQCRICILLNLAHPSNLWGHAWLRNGDHDIPTKKRRCDAKITKIAENDLFEYYTPVLGPEVKVT